jgi:hypothetical protein
VSQFKILALLDIGAAVTVRDWPYWADGSRSRHPCPMPTRLRLKALAAPDPHRTRSLRVAAYDFATTPGVPTLVMVTSETGRIRLENVAGGIPIGAAVAASDALIHTPSRWSRDGLVANGIPADRIAVIGHGADTALWRPAGEAERHSLRRRLGWDDAFVTSVSAMTENKGIDLCLRLRRAARNLSAGTSRAERARRHLSFA